MQLLSQCVGLDTKLEHWASDFITSLDTAR